jgi:hypothetical protein
MLENINSIPFLLRLQYRGITAHPYAIRLCIRTDAPLVKCCLQGTIRHFGRQESHLTIRYYYQDLH